MFTWLNKQGVQSARGFAVQFTGRYSAEYREGNRKMTLKIEDGLNEGSPCIILGPDAFNCWDLDNTLLSDSEKERLLGNFRDACEFQGFKVIIERARTESEGRSGSFQEMGKIVR